MIAYNALLTPLWEYYTSSSLFMSSSGVFLIGADSGQLIEGPVTEEKYYSSVGAYIDLIANTAAKAKIQPKIQLIATKGQPGVKKDVKEACDTILQKAKKHLEAFDEKINLFLVDEVLVTSSEHVTRELMQRLSLTLSVLSTDEQLNEKREGRTPTEWFSVTQAIKDKVVVNVSQVAEIQREMQERMLKSEALDTKEVDTFRKLQTFVEEMKVVLPFGDVSVEVQDQTDSTEETLEAPEVNEHDEKNEDTDERTLPEEQPSDNFVDATTGSSQTTDQVEANREGLKAIEVDERMFDDPKVSTSVKAMLRYFVAKGELLWFENVLNLRDLVIPQPMEFVRSLRTVLSHDIREKLKDDRGRLRGAEAKQEDEDIEQKGTMSRKTFEKIFQRSDQVNFSADQVWHFLIQLGLAIPILGKEEEPRILVPSLISDKTRDTMMKRAEERDDTITLQYAFDWNYKSLQSFDDLVVIFTRLFFKEGGEGEIAQCFSQKIEKRTLGCVAGVYGKFTVPQTSEYLSFTLLQYDTLTQK